MLPFLVASLHGPAESEPPALRRNSSHRIWIFLKRMMQRSFYARCGRNQTKGHLTEDLVTVPIQLDTEPTRLQTAYRLPEINKIEAQSSHDHDTSSARRANFSDAGPEALLMMRSSCTILLILCRLCSLIKGKAVWILFLPSTCDALTTLIPASSHHGQRM